MPSKYLPEISATELQHAREKEDNDAYYDLLAQPLHQELYKRQDFNFLDDLSEGQKLLLSFDYIREQVLQGGFIQMIQNGYVGLVPQMPAWLTEIGDTEMAKLLDDALKVYVLNHELMNKKTTVEEFALLYQELKEFEELDERFMNLHILTRNMILDYATKHIDEFALLR